MLFSVFRFIMVMIMIMIKSLYYCKGGVSGF